MGNHSSTQRHDAASASISHSLGPPIASAGIPTSIRRQNNAATVQSSNAPLPANSVDMPLPQATCGFCRSIRFQDLPSEDEPGLPHQPSLQALRASASTCTMCRLMLAAVLKVREEINDRSVPRGGWIEFYRNQMPSGRVRMEETVFGAFGPGSNLISGTPPGYERPPPDRLRDQFLDDTSVRPWLFGNWWKADDESAPDQLIGLGVRLSVTPYIEDAEGNTRDEHWDNVVLRGTHLRTRIYEEQPLARIIPGRLIAAGSDSTIALQRLQRWVGSCNDHHTCVPIETLLPTRVLDLGLDPNAQHIKLVETSKGQRGSYVALSHCWGKSHRITTTISTLAIRQQGISLRELPATFLDAVTVTRYLRKRYLWIDSLCIIQGDNLDWEQEASKMAFVYGNSYLTISASASRDDSTGCFPCWPMRSGISQQAVSPDSRSLGREPLFAHAAPFVHRLDDSAEVTYRSTNIFAWIENIHNHRTSRVCISVEWMPSSIKSRPMEYCVPRFGRPGDPLEGQPLNKRGWTLQERLLSPRIVHYDVGQMYWECKCSFLAEDGSCIDRNPLHVENLLRGQRLPLSSHGIALSERPDFHLVAHTLPDSEDVVLIEGYPPPPTTPIGRWKGGWLSVVEEYSKRCITEVEDKLPALSGLASLLASETGDAYYARLWRNHILEDLHWRVQARVEMRILAPGGFLNLYGRDLCTPIRPAGYRAPSWSWASLDAQIRFVPLDFDHILAEFMDCHVARSEIDPFGQVSDGWIRIRGPLLSVSRADENYDPSPLDPLGFGELVEIHLPHGVSYGEAYFDFESQFPCYALFLDPSNSLILAPGDPGREEGVYKRLGVAKFLRTQWQRINLPLVGGENGQVKMNKVPFGPILSGYPCTVVTIL